MYEKDADDGLFVDNNIACIMAIMTGRPNVFVLLFDGQSRYYKVLFGVNFGVWCSFCWKYIKRKSLKLLGTSRSFRLRFA